MKQVTALATRAGKWWEVRVPDVDGLFTQARTLDQVPAMVQDAAQLLIGEEVEVVVKPILADEIEESVEQLKRLSAEAERAQTEASAVSRSLVSALRERGLTVRDVGTVLGISPQRVSQLAG